MMAQAVGKTNIHINDVTEYSSGTLNVIIVSLKMLFHGTIMINIQNTFKSSDCINVCTILSLIGSQLNASPSYVVDLGKRTKDAKFFGRMTFNETH